HPASGEYMEFEAPLPEDFQTLVQVLEADREAQ
ncbi:MAG: RNA pseudouridine synthase, partial [Alcanivorax sp.]|nr:RNA pseudouridine synthase [Alcanivorax sp.]